MRARIIIFAILMIAMAAICAFRLRIGTDITNFMPDGKRARLATLSRKLANSELTRTMTISVGAPDIDTAVAAATSLAEKLRVHPEVEWLRTAMREDAFDEALQLYLPRTFYHASDEPERELPKMLTDVALRAAAAQRLSELRQPTATAFKQFFAHDPLGLFRRFMEEAQSSQPEVPTHAGQIVSQDGRHALILLGTVHSHFASDIQARFLADLGEAIEAVNAQHPGLLFETSGANRIAVSSEESIKSDVYLIGICTFVGVAILFLVFFRSLKSFALASLPAVFGALSACTAGLIVLGGIDGLTVAFGAAMMGVAIDYSIHVINHHALAANRVSANQTVERLKPSLLLGAFTTMASFAGLLMTSSPAFRELGFFSIVGIAASLGATLYLLPALLTNRRRVPKISKVVANTLGRAVDNMRRRQIILRAATIAVLLLAAMTIPSLQWVDDLSQLGNVDRSLIEEDIRVRSRLPSFDTRRFVVALAADQETALQKNDQIYSRLQKLVVAGDIGGIRSLHQLVRSRELQLRNLNTLRAEKNLAERVDAAFRSVGFKRGAFDAFGNDLASPPPPITLADLRASALGPLLGTLALSLGDSFAAITYLRDVRSLDIVRAAISDIEGVVLFDQREFVNEIYREFRNTTLQQILVGTVLVGFVLLLRYRAWRPATAAILPALMVVITLLGGFAWFGVQTNLLHVISLMMVMGMGVDYGVFLVDSAGDTAAFDATMLSLLLSCLTTVLVFGTLAISEHPALRAIGTTTGVGVLLAFLYAPLSLLITNTTSSR